MEFPKEVEVEGVEGAVLQQMVALAVLPIQKLLIRKILIYFHHEVEEAVLHQIQKEMQ